VVAAAAAPRARGLRALALVSPPVQGLRGEALAGVAAAKLILSGEMDAFAPPEELRRWAQGLGQPCDLVLLPGVDHFWSLGFQTAAARVVAFFRKHLGPRGGRP
jgi:alpha/beta superfamily hydrolase